MDANGNLDLVSNATLMRHDVRGRGTLALPQRGFVLLAQGGSLMALTLNPEWGDML